jgi:hypothetical protein
LFYSSKKSGSILLCHDNTSPIQNVRFECSNLTPGDSLTFVNIIGINHRIFNFRTKKKNVLILIRKYNFSANINVSVTF